MMSPHVATRGTPLERVRRSCGCRPTSRLDLVGLELDLTVSRAVPRGTKGGPQGGAAALTTGSEPAGGQLDRVVHVAAGHRRGLVERGEDALKEVDRAGVSFT